MVKVIRTGTWQHGVVFSFHFFFFFSLTKPVLLCSCYYKIAQMILLSHCFWIKFCSMCLQMYAYLALLNPTGFLPLSILVLPTRFAKLAEPCLKLEAVNKNITVFILSCCLYKRYFVYSANGQIQANMQSRRWACNYTSSHADNLALSGEYIFGSVPWPKGGGGGK